MHKVNRMVEVGNKMIEKYFSPQSQYRIGFMQPPFNTVEQLHMHIHTLPLTCGGLRAWALSKAFITVNQVLSKLTTNYPSSKL